MTTGSKPEPALQVLKNGTQPNACWSCGDMRAALFCDSCGKLQPAVPADYFGFFGLARKLNIDAAELEQEFYRLSRKLHPDLYARTSRQEQQWSLEKSSQLNDAYRALRDPIARTEYLLKLEGLKLEEQSKAATERARESGQQKKQMVAPELLEEVFELNLQVEEARLNKKMGERDAELTRQLEDTRDRLRAKHDALMGELRGHWNEWDALLERAPSQPERRTVCEKMLGVLNRRSYIRNLVRDVNEVLDE
jgi:molecular chaperone HscB